MSDLKTTLYNLIFDKIMVYFDMFCSIMKLRIVGMRCNTNTISKQGRKRTNTICRSINKAFDQIISVVAKAIALYLLLVLHRITTFCLDDFQEISESPKNI